MKIHRRQFNRLVVAAPVFALPAAQAARGADSRKWYERLTAGVHLDYHYPEWDPYIISKADGRKIIQEMARIGSELVVIFAKCHYGNSYYNTRVGHKHKNLTDRDLLEECAHEAKQHKITLLAYYSVNRDVWAGRRHPEWRMKDVEGNSVDEDRWPPEWASMGFLCYNSPYLDYVKEQVKEIMEYDIGGFHFDMLWFGTTGGVCYCKEYCQPLFRKKYGIDMPPRPTWDEPWRRYLEFRYDSNAGFCQELNRLIRTKRPDMSVMYNYHATPPSSWQAGMLPVRHRLLSDYGTGEGYPPVHGHTYASFMSCFLAGVKPNSPWQGVTSRYTRVINDHTVRPLADMKWETFTFLSHGGMPLFVDTPEDDGVTLDPVAYDRMAEVLREARQKSETFGHAHLPEVGLYFSSKTRDWYGRENPEVYFNPFMGAHQILIESHIPVEFLFDETVTLERLRRFPVIFLANTAVLGPAEVELFRTYVEEGGRLIATFETSRFDADGKEQKDFGLSELLGVRYQGKTEYNANYFRVREGPLSQGIRANYDVLVQGPNNVVSVTGGTPEGELKIAFHDRGLRTHIGHAPQNSPWKTVGPAVVFNRTGRGQIAYTPFSAEAAYVGTYPVEAHRLLIRNLVRRLYPTPPVSVEAPLSVESVITHDQPGRRYILHFINFTGRRDGQAQTVPGLPILGRMRPQTQVALMEETRPYVAHVAASVPIRSARALGKESRVIPRANGIRLESSEVHDTVVLAY